MKIVNQLSQYVLHIFKTKLKDEEKEITMTNKKITNSVQQLLSIT